MAPGTSSERTFPEDRRKPILIDVDEATNLLSLSKSYLYRETRAGNIPHVKIGSRILFKLSD
jgi:excisionase family DNA binding protein